jgi:hypothetical protein
MALFHRNRSHMAKLEIDDARPRGGRVENEIPKMRIAV